MTSDRCGVRIPGIRFIALLTSAVFLCVLPAYAAGGSGSGLEDGSGDAMTWVSIGLVVVVGGLLFLDVLAGPDGTALEPDSVRIESSDTGVDWDSLFPPESTVLTIGVSAIRTSEAAGIPAALIDLLTREAPAGILVYPEPVDLGGGSAVAQAGLASAYLGVDLLVAWMPAGGEDILLLQAATPEGMLLSFPTFPDDGLEGLADSVLHAAITLLEEPEAF